MSYKILLFLSRFSTQESSFPHHRWQEYHFIPLPFVELDELFWKRNSSDSIVPVASTHEFSSMLGVIACDLSTLVELTISPFSGESSWSCQGSSTDRFGSLDTTILEFDPSHDVDGTCISIPS